MGTSDRDWYRREVRKKREFRWNERSGEMEFDDPAPQRRWRWPYRLRPTLPYRVRAISRQALFWGAIALAYLVLREYV